MKTALLFFAFGVLLPLHHALGSLQIIIDVQSQGTNAVYSLAERERPLGEIEDGLRKLRAGTPEQAKQLTVYVRPRGSVTPEALLPVFEMLKRVGWEKGELLISTEDQDIYTAVKVPFEAQRVQMERFDKHVDPFAAFRNFDSGSTNKLPNKAVEGTGANDGARPSP